MRTLGEIQPGQTVGRYEFLVPIAQGGMAAVWAARLKGSRGFSKTVAVKTMLPTISDDPHFEQMFLDEAQLCSRIRHPNVVEIMDLGEQDDLLYLVMEWVDGEPLSSIRRAAAKTDGIPRPIAVKIVAEAASGLHAAHELKDDSGEPVGLVHRDVSPQNLLITYDGVVKIVDFGVAKAAGRTAENTNAGQIKGKPPYMSPEQALGRDIDRRSDVFALGIILYQLTTGKHPFRGETDVITLQNIVSDRPIIPPRAYDKEYPKPLESVVMRALERDPQKRFQTAGELEAALDRVFPPSVGRVRAEDVGKFVTALLGARGEERRAALKEAIRQADERAAQRESEPALGGELGTTVAPMPSNPFVASAPLHTPLSGPERGSVSDITGAPLSYPETPFGTQTPSAPPMAKKRGGLGWVVAGLVVFLGMIAGALFVTRTFLLNDDAAAAAAPAAAPELSSTVATEPTEAVATPGAEQPKGEPEATVDLNSLAVEKNKPAAARPAAAPTKAGKPSPAAEKPAPKPEPKPEAKPEPKPKPEAKPAPKPSTGFVPPPITDPGF
ncbi:MAG: serine/threonine-protein kinase [Polyangiaceae bacterium]